MHLCIYCVSYFIYAAYSSVHRKSIGIYCWNYYVHCLSGDSQLVLELCRLSRLSHHVMDRWRHQKRRNICHMRFRWEAKGFNYQSFAYWVRSFFLWGNLVFSSFDGQDVFVTCLLNIGFVCNRFFLHYIYLSLGDIRGTVVARWTAGKQVERSILRQGHDS